MYEIEYDGEDELVYSPPVPVPKKRASAQYEDHTTPAPNVREIPREKRSSRYFLFYCGFGMLLFLFGYLVWTVVLVPWWTGISDQWHYGDARVSVFNADVGHGGMSRFLAFDEEGDVTIIEIVGKKYQVYTGAVRVLGNKLVTLTITDVDQDGKPDLVVHIEGMSATLVLFNTGSAFSWTSK